MNTALALAALVSMVAANPCVISGSYKRVSATCSMTGGGGFAISDACCAKAQAQVNTVLGNLDVKPSDEDMQAVKQCLGQPDTVKCTETVVSDRPDDGAETGCTLHGEFPGVDITCKIPKATTISSTCCSALQSTIEVKRDSLEQRLGKTAQQECQSLIDWQKMGMGLAGPPPQGPVMSKDTFNYYSSKLIAPAGLSCTEKKETPIGLSHSILAALRISGRKNVALASQDDDGPACKTKFGDMSARCQNCEWAAIDLMPTCRSCSIAASAKCHGQAASSLATISDDSPAGVLAVSACGGMFGGAVVGLLAMLYHRRGGARPSLVEPMMA